MATLPRHATNSMVILQSWVQNHLFTMCSDFPWLFYSSASNHITNDLANLTLSKEFGEDEHLFIVDSKSLSILNISNTTLITPTKFLTLNDVLHVPNTTQNLVLISQLCQTNRVSIQFLPWNFQIKDEEDATSRKQ